MLYISNRVKLCVYVRCSLLVQESVTCKNRKRVAVQLGRAAHKYSSTNILLLLVRAFEFSFRIFIFGLSFGPCILQLVGPLSFGLY